MAIIEKLKIAKGYNTWEGVNKQKTKFKIPDKNCLAEDQMTKLVGKWVSAEVNPKKKRVECIILDEGKSAEAKNKPEIKADKLFADAKKKSDSVKKNWQQKQNETKGKQSRIGRPEEHGEPAKTGAFSPFNFVELPENEVKFSKVIKKYSGSVHCNLKTLTPFFIRNGEFKVTKEEKPTPDFFQLQNGQPAIPATSIKGMLRNMVAQITGGDSERVNDTFFAFRDFSMKKDFSDKFSAGIGNFKVKAGKIQQNGDQFVIIPCAYSKVKHSVIAEYFSDNLIFDNGKSRNSFNGDVFQHQKEIVDRFSQPVRFNSSAITPDLIKKKRTNRTVIKALNKQGDTEGELLISGAMDGKKHEAVFYNFDESSRIEIPEKILKDYNKDVTDYKETFYKAAPNKQIKNDDLIFYLNDTYTNELLFFGRASLFRIVYKNNASDFVPSYLKKESTWQESSVVNNLFGFIGKQFAQMGKIGVSYGKFDYALDENGKKHEAHQQLNSTAEWLQLLASPKASAYQFYLAQKEEDYVRNYNASPSENRIAGYKNYWHKPATSQQIFEQGEAQEKAQTKAIVLSSDNYFSFSIEFTDIDDSELGLLLFVLKLWGEESAHKLGSGKPLGMGSVKLQIESVELNNATNKRYTKILEDSGWYEDQQKLDELEIEKYINSFKKEYCNATGYPSFDQIPNIQDLRALLNWEKASENVNEKQYMSLEKKAEKTAWREHRILPKARDFYKER